MATPREDLDRLRKLKRLKDLEARSTFNPTGNDQEPQVNNQQPENITQEQVDLFANINPMTDISFAGVTAEDVQGAGNLALNVGTGLVARPIAGGAALADIAQGEGVQGAETVERLASEIQTPLSPEGQKVAQGIGGLISELGDNPAFAEIGDMLKSAQNALTEFGGLAVSSLTDPIGTAESIIDQQALDSQASNVGRAVFGALPETALEVTAFMGGGSSQAIRASKLGNLGKAVENVSKATKAKTVTDSAIDSIGEAIKKGTPEELATIINADKNFFAAADELGIISEPLASFASKNPQFVAVESGLASVPSSVLDVQTKAFIKELSQKADNIIEKFGGTLDKGDLNLNFARRNLETVGELAQKADDVYGTIAKILPKSERFPATNTVNFIDNLASDLGGVNELPSKLKNMLASLKTKKGLVSEDLTPANIISDFKGAAKSSGVNVALSSGRSESGKAVIIDKIIVPELSRGRGVGSKLMNDLITKADKNNITLALTPSKDFGGNAAGLKRFYKGLGFVENKGRNKDFSISEKLIKPPSKTTKTTKDINPTLGKIDQLRREVGQAINKKSGSFKDVEQGLNKALYNRLASDQDAIAISKGFGEITESAKGLIKQRKGLEDNLTLLLGKDLNKSLSATVGSSLKGLAKGDIQRFKNIVNAIPKNQRGEILLSSINDVFKGSGVNQQALSVTGYTKWFESINRSPVIKKELFKSLPLGSQRALTNLYKVSKGVSNALGDRVTTGRLNAIFNDETGFIRKIVGKAAPSLVAFATGSPVAAAATSASVDFLRQGTAGAKRASDLLASPNFQSVVRRSAKEGVLDAGKSPSIGLKKAENALTSSKQAKDWMKTQNKKNREQIQNRGLIAYLFLNNIQDDRL